MPPAAVPFPLQPPSPASRFNAAAAGFLDSPILLTPSLFPSPMTGAFPSEPLNWLGTPEDLQESVKGEQRPCFDFTFQTAAASGATLAEPFPQTSSMPMAAPVGGLGDSYNDEQQQPWSYQAQQAMDFNEAPFEAPSSVITTAVTQPDQLGSGGYSSTVSSGFFREQQSRRSSDDGYNWRKYGQKQMKGSENPRSYYKCSFPGCPTKKKVERSPAGQVTEIVYKGTHNHPKPQSTRRGGSSASADSYALAAASANNNDAAAAAEHSFGTLSGTPVATPENSSGGSFGDDEINGVCSRMIGDLGSDHLLLADDEPDSKKCRRNDHGVVGDGTSVMTTGGGNRAVREPRVVVQTMSDVDVLDDGFRWRKYGQKVVKGNPNPRSYYKCTTPGCPVRKHVERACHDTRAVVTTYEGKHNHDVPPARGGSCYRAAVVTTASSLLPPAAMSYSQQQGGRVVATSPDVFFGHRAPTVQPSSAERGGFAWPAAFGSDTTCSAYHPYTTSQQQCDAMSYYASETKDEPRDDDMSFFEQPLLF